MENLEKIVEIEIDRSRSRSNHLNKMMRMLMKSQKDIQKKTQESYSMLSAEIDKQISNLKYHTPPHSPASSAGGNESENTPPDHTMVDISSDSNSDGSTPPDPAVDPATIDIPTKSHDDQPTGDDPEEVRTVSKRVAAALKDRGIPDDLKINFEVHSVHGPRLLVTRKTRLEGMAEQRVQECVFKFAAGLAHLMGWPQPVPYTETFTGTSAASNGVCVMIDCDCILCI